MFKLLSAAMLLTFLGACSSIDGLRCFSLDGKASSSCQSRLEFERKCEDHEGLAVFNAVGGYCKDGTEVKRGE